MNNNIVKAGNYEVIFSSFIGKPEYLIVYDKFFYWFNVSLSWDENFGIHHLPQIWKPDKKLHVIEIRCLLWYILFNFDYLYTPLTYFSISTTYTHPWICSHDKGVEGGCHIIFNLIAHIHISAVPAVASQMNIITQKAPSEACKIHQSININILSWKTRLACVLFSATLNERF